MLLLRVGWVRGRLGIVRSIYICLVTKLYNIKLGSDVKLVNYIVVTAGGCTVERERYKE